MQLIDAVWAYRWIADYNGYFLSSLAFRPGREKVEQIQESPPTSSWQHVSSRCEFISHCLGDAPWQISRGCHVQPGGRGSYGQWAVLQAVVEDKRVIQCYGGMSTIHLLGLCHPMTWSEVVQMHAAFKMCEVQKPQYLSPPTIQTDKPKERAIPSLLLDGEVHPSTSCPCFALAMANLAAIFAGNFCTQRYVYHPHLSNTSNRISFAGASTNEDYDSFISMFYYKLV